MPDRSPAAEVTGSGPARSGPAVTGPARPGSPRSGPARPGTAWAAVAVAVVAGLLVAGRIGALIAALPTLRESLGMSLTLSGTLIGMFAAAAAVLGVAMGSLVARVGPRATLVGGLLVVAAGSALGAAAGSGAHLLASTLVEGVGFVAVVVSAPSLIARASAPADSGLALGFWSTYMAAGQAGMTVVVPWTLVAWGWRGTWLAVAAALVGTAAVAWWVLGRTVPRDPEPTDGRVEDDRVAPPRTRRGELREALRHPAPRTLAMIFGIYALQFSVMAFLPSVLSARGFAPGTATTLTGLVIAANLLGNLTAGTLLRRGARHATLITVAAATMGTAAVGAFTGVLPPALAYACAVAFSAVGGMLPATVLAAVPVLAPRSGLVPVTNGLVGQAVGVGMLLGPIAVGALADATGGWHTSPLLITTAAGLIVLLARRLHPGPT